MNQTTPINNRRKMIACNGAACEILSGRVVDLFNTDLKIDWGQLLLSVIKMNGRCVTGFIKCLSRMGVIASIG